MSADFDEGSFPKARGWLLAFSSVLIALWFFGADLTSLSVLGTKIEFTRNTQHVWLVALGINAYLLLRFYQHQPSIAYSDLVEYRKYYEHFMLRIMRRLHARSIDQEVLERGKGHIPPASEGGNVKSVIETFQFTRVTEPSEKRRNTVGMKELAIVHAYCIATSKDGSHCATTPTYQVDRVCPYWLIRLCTWFSKLNVWVRTSYATEHLLPYLWSGFAAAVCLLRWSTAIVS